LRELLNVPMDLLLVVGGYNSSNTSHLPRWVRKNCPPTRAQRLSAVSATEIKHYDLHEKREVVSHFWLPNGPAVIGITAGASCPNNLIEETLIRLLNCAASPPGPGTRPLKNLVGRLTASAAGFGSTCHSGAHNSGRFW